MLELLVSMDCFLLGHLAEALTPLPLQSFDVREGCLAEHFLRVRKHLEDVGVKFPFLPPMNPSFPNSPEEETL